MYAWMRGWQLNQRGGKRGRDGTAVGQHSGLPSDAAPPAIVGFRVVLVVVLLPIPRRGGRPFGVVLVVVAACRITPPVLEDLRGGAGVGPRGAGIGRSSSAGNGESVASPALRMLLVHVTMQWRSARRINGTWWRPPSDRQLHLTRSRVCRRGTALLCLWLGVCVGV